MFVWQKVNTVILNDLVIIWHQSMHNQHTQGKLFGACKSISVTAFSDEQQRKHQISALMAFANGITDWLLDRLFKNVPG